MLVSIVDVFKSPYAKIIPIQLGNVVLKDSFWKPRIEKLIRTSLPLQYEYLEKTGRVDNLRAVAGKEVKGCLGLGWFNDSDVYKWIEAAAYALNYVQDPDLLNKITSLSKIVEEAQEADGYLNTYVKLKNKKRWENLAWSHELYCAGHLIQAGIAVKRVLQDLILYNVAKKFADLIANTFDWDKLETSDGHPEVEMALVELYRESEDRAYLDAARFFIDVRGYGKVARQVPEKNRPVNPVYLVDHAPIKYMEDFAGSHAVRALYFFGGATDLYLEIGDQELWDALKRLWVKTTMKMYITGGLGSRYEGESFGEDYELPNYRAYSETCAAVAGVMWAWRMFLASGDPEYMDTLETILYNAALAGISIDGSKYFYVNPLADYYAKYERQPWFECACCPPNIARLITWVPSIAYSFSKNVPKIWVNLFIESEAKFNLLGNTVKIYVETKYPWDGYVSVKVYPANGDEVSIAIRIPKWARGAKVKLNNDIVDATPGKYFEVSKSWNFGETIKVYIPMKPRFIEAHPWIESNYGRTAIVRGPIVYCVEQVDNKDFDINNLVVDVNSANLREEYREDILDGVTIIKGEGYDTNAREWGSTLYRDLDEVPTKYVRRVSFTAIPYYAWNNRGPTKMSIWLKKRLLHYSNDE